MKLPVDFSKEVIVSDPTEVDRLITALGGGLRRAITPGVTTQADLISAIFTILHMVLKSAEEQEDPEDHERNSQEIGRILANFLMEFGHSGPSN